MRCWLVALLCLAGAIATATEPLQTFTQVHYRENSINDGDSFWVQTATTSMIVRLYFVDCPETSAFHEAMARRVREQMRYFGLHEVKDAMAFGVEAGATTRELLAQPFTIHTAFSPGGGSSGHARYYAFVTLADGRDLGSLLVARGVARVMGAGRPTPDGTSQAEQWDRLRDLEDSAMLRHAGIWASADPTHLAADRAEQRREDEELMRIEAGASPSSGKLLNINLATKEDLLMVPGIGPVTAERIVAGRPYTNVIDLARVKGLGPKSIARFEGAFTTSE
ncbi:MAG: helix-hairpin-helix domain-containing protein [Lentisphaerae bacterium]|nr:helix-hairpin-helix domain-containing protein [Lentisphaerota bacterium]